MYKLTLTPSERRAIDWIGDRYAHGYDLYHLLWGTDCEITPEEVDWDSPVDILFDIPENVAWLIVDIIEGPDGLACFSGDFQAKLYDFSAKIV